MKNLKTYENFTINESNDSLDIWKKMMDEKDLKLFSIYQSTSKTDIEKMREDWKVLRRDALSKLNDELNDSGKSGKIHNIDVSDDELYKYVDGKINKEKFFKYSRILDFADGYKPKNLILFKK